MKAVRVAVFLNPANGPRNTNLQLVQEAARVIGLQIHVLNASTISEIDEAFATLARERADALFVNADGFFNSRRVLGTLMARLNDARRSAYAAYVHELTNAWRGPT